jgi:hypothetical protein
MNQRQLASVLFAAVGVFLVISRLQQIFSLAAAVIPSTVTVNAPPVPDGQRLALAVALLGSVLAVLFGSALILLRYRVANLLFPPAAAAVSSREVQAVALSVLGCYFAVQGVSNLSWAGRLDWSGAIQLVLGIALFFGARGLSRLWSLGRSAGHQGDVRGGAV